MNRIVPFDALSDEELGSWRALRAANPGLDSPYFHPGFAAAVHASGPPVSVVVMRDAAGKVSALLPGHREGRRLRPVGWPGADFQGPVLEPGTELHPTEFLVDGIREFDFDHLLPPGPEFDPWVIARQPSPYLDTTGGLDGYLSRASRSGKDKMKEARRCLAKAERTHGLMRFAADVVDDAVLDQVIALKRAQYAATGSRDYFGKPERTQLIHRLLHTRDIAFGGVLSTVHVGDRLMGAHFGIRSDHVLHWWFPVYDREFAPLSPGWILLREFISATPTLGINRIDLGRGDDDYKRRAKTGEVSVSQGSVNRSRARHKLRKARHATINAAKASPAGPGLRQMARRLRGARLSTQTAAKGD
ncbi:CelD/BcsL family acetyltransferase involved in cellulose biosynthesis [Mycobacterium sp. URHB0021]